LRKSAAARLLLFHTILQKGPQSLPAGSNRPPYHLQCEIPDQYPVNMRIAASHPDRMSAMLKSKPVATGIIAFSNGWTKDFPLMFVPGQGQPDYASPGLPHL